MLAALAALLAAEPTCAADLSPNAGADLRRALAAVGPSSSEAPALRQEQQAHDPSPGFLLGAALGAWINAAAQVAFDRANPAAAGAAHASQVGGDPEAVAEDCADEKVAFDHLETRRRALDLTPDGVAAAAAIGPAVLTAWRGRRSAPPALCR